MNAYEQMVLDSEDEEMNGSKVVTVSKGLRDNKVYRTVKNPRLKPHNRHFERPSPSKQPEKGSANTSVSSFGKPVTGDKETSTDAERPDNRNRLNPATKLSKTPSPEIGELTQDALGYVDHYLSVNKVEVSPGICHRKAGRKKSPPLMSARGARNLAKKIQAQTYHEEKRPFECVDTGRDVREAGIFHKSIAVSSNFRVCGQTYKRRKYKSGYPDNQETCSTGNGCEEKLAQGLGTVAENNNSIEELNVPLDAAEKNIDAYSGVEHKEDTSDIGLDTQVAAEAMEGLAYLHHPDGRCTRVKDQSSKDRKRNNNFVDGGIVRSKWKRTGLTADPFKPLYNAKCIGTGTMNEAREVLNANGTCYKHHKKPSNKNLPKSYLLKELIRLGVSEYTPELIGKNLRQRKDTSHVRVLFSQHLDESIIKQQKKILARMNISSASTPMEATHFVADKFTRTKNMLETMALGKLVVTHLWLESCGHANYLVDEKSYILRDVKKEKEMGFTMPVSLARAKQQPLLQGKSVFITPHIKPDKIVITNLVTAAHGQIHTGKNGEMLNNLLIISCEEDREVCRPFLQRGITVYGSELLLSGIVTQKLELERHKLFANRVARKCLDTSCRRFGNVYRRRRNLSGDHIHS